MPINATDAVINGDMIVLGPNDLVRFTATEDCYLFINKSLIEISIGKSWFKLPTNTNVQVKESEIVYLRSLDSINTFMINIIDQTYDPVDPNQGTGTGGLFIRLNDSQDQGYTVSDIPRMEQTHNPIGKNSISIVDNNITDMLTPDTYDNDEHSIGIFGKGSIVIGDTIYGGNALKADNSLILGDRFGFLGGRDEKEQVRNSFISGYNSVISGCINSQLLSVNSYSGTMFRIDKIKFTTDERDVFTITIYNDDGLFQLDTGENLDVVIISRGELYSDIAYLPVSLIIDEFKILSGAVVISGTFEGTEENKIALVNLYDDTNLSMFLDRDKSNIYGSNIIMSETGLKSDIILSNVIAYQANTEDIRLSNLNSALSYSKYIYESNVTTIFSKVGGLRHTDLHAEESFVSGQTLGTINVYRSVVGVDSYEILELSTDTITIRCDYHTSTLDISIGDRVVLFKENTPYVLIVTDVNSHDAMYYNAIITVDMNNHPIGSSLVRVLTLEEPKERYLTTLLDIIDNEPEILNENREGRE